MADEPHFGATWEDITLYETTPTVKSPIRPPGGLTFIRIFWGGRFPYFAIWSLICETRGLIGFCYFFPGVLSCGARAKAAQGSHGPPSEGQGFRFGGCQCSRCPEQNEHVLHETSRSHVRQATSLSQAESSQGRGRGGSSGRECCLCRLCSCWIQSRHH